MAAVKRQIAFVYLKEAIMVAGGTATCIAGTVDPSSVEGIFVRVDEFQQEPVLPRTIKFFAADQVEQISIETFDIDFDDPEWAHDIRPNDKSIFYWVE